MGNCCPRGSPSSMVWASDEWELPATEKEGEQPPLYKQRLLSHLKATSSPSSKPLPPRGGSTTEVKIKITKKELDELLRKAKMQKLSSEQVLAGIIDASSSCYTVHHHERHWRPGLSSIPEVN